MTASGIQNAQQGLGSDRAAPGGSGGPHFSTGGERPASALPAVSRLLVQATGASASVTDPLGSAPAFSAASSEAEATDVFRNCPPRLRRLRLDSPPCAEAPAAPERPQELRQPMPLSKRLTAMLAMARGAVRETEADAVLLLAEWPLDWQAVRKELDPSPLIVAATSAVRGSEVETGKGEPGSGSLERDSIQWIRLEDSNSPTAERLTMALLDAVADERLRPGASVVALYSGFDADEIDSLSIVRLGEHLERLTAADLRKLETQVPLETLKAVVDLAVEIGREGREGHPVGTMFIVGDTRKVLKLSWPMGYDPVRGYSKKERSVRERRNRESIKEISKLDGAMIIDRLGEVVSAARYVDAPAAGITMSKGLGSRHWAAAAITKATKAIAIVVSQSSGTLRIFQNGQVVLRIEPLRRAMKWQEFESEPPPPPEWLA